MAGYFIANMANRKRYLTIAINSSEDLNDLSLGAFKLWVFMLVNADDFGVIPASAKGLRLLVPWVEFERIEEWLSEIFAHGFGEVFLWKDKRYFRFDEKSFETHQNWILRHRTQSEFLGLKARNFEEFQLERENSQLFRRIPADSCELSHLHTNTIPILNPNTAGMRGNIPAELGEVGNARENSGKRGNKAPRRTEFRDVKPDMAIEYFGELGLPRHEAEKFLDHYAANGFKQKGGTKIVDWKAAARNWRSNFEKFGGEVKANRPAGKNGVDADGQAVVDGMKFYTVNPKYAGLGYQPKPRGSNAGAVQGVDVEGLVEKA